MSAVAELNRFPIVLRSLFYGALGGWVVGGIAGLIIGIRTHIPTAWFAIFEVGIPAGLVGGLFGGIVGVTLWAFRKIFNPSHEITGNGDVLRPGMAFGALSGAVLGMVCGPLAGWGFLSLVDVLDPNQALSFGPALIMCSLAPSALVLALVKVRRLRDIAIGFSFGSAIACLVLAVPILAMDLVFGDF